jgi:citrate lyase subunit beta/citryl-CoA lyase
MVFDDISIFELMNDEELQNFIQTPKRVKTEILNPRSSMMLNPLKLKHLNNIDNLKADIIVINLEDGVAPQMKKRALLLTAVFLSHLKNSKSRIIVRVNPLKEGGETEIRFLNQVKPDVIRVAKIRERSDVEEVLNILAPDIKLHLSIETKESLLNLTSLNVNGKVECGSLGIMDMLHSLSLSQSLLSFDNETVKYIMSRFLVDAKIAGIYPIGFTYQDYEDLRGFRRWCEIEKKMGYRGKSCLGPKQVEIVNEVFKTDADAIKRAKEVKELFEKMVKKGESGFMHLDYGFIDEPIYKDALLTLGQV